MEKISQLWVLNIGILIFAPTVCHHRDNELARRDIRKKKKLQDISEEKGAPQTTKQTVTLTTVAGQKAQEKSLNGTYRL